MLFLVEMEVRIPHDVEAALVEELKAAEAKRAQELQRSGQWRHLWRVVGRYANVSIFDAGSHDELHAMLSGLPLFPYLDIRVTPLATHPSALPDGNSTTPGRP
jgi:muconolactone D-isomerase